jgi:hypothetical protein
MTVTCMTTNSERPNIAEMLADYAADHLEHFDCFPVDCEIEGIIYDFDTVVAAYDQQHGD